MILKNVPEPEKNMWPRYVVTGSDLINEVDLITHKMLQANYRLSLLLIYNIVVSGIVVLYELFQLVIPEEQWIIDTKIK